MQNDQIIQIAPTEITIDPEFSKLYQLEDDTDGEIEASMKIDGFDPAEPLALWRDPATNRLLLVEGHRRHTWAIRTHHPLVWAVIKDFKNRDEAKKYIKKRQRLRRQTTKATILHALLTHPLYAHGGKRLEGSRQPEGLLDKQGGEGIVTLQQIADDNGVKRLTVARVKQRYFDKLELRHIVGFNEGKITAAALIREIDDLKEKPTNTAIERLLFDEFKIHLQETRAFVQRAKELKVSPRPLIAKLVRDFLQSFASKKS